MRIQLVPVKAATEGDHVGTLQCLNGFIRKRIMEHLGKLEGVQNVKRIAWDIVYFETKDGIKAQNVLEAVHAAAIPIEKLYPLPKFHVPSPERCYAPCGFCDFYASNMCSECEYGPVCEAEMRGFHSFCVGGDLTQNEAIKFADNVRRKWERKEMQKVHPRTWPWHLFFKRLGQRLRAIKWAYIMWRWRRGAEKHSRRQK